MKPFYWICRAFAKTCAVLLYRHKVYGLEHIVPGAAILAPNHASFIDPPLVGISITEEIAYLARKTLFDNRLLGLMIRHLNTYPIEGTTHDLALFKLIFHLLKEGQKVVIFPEGERTETGHMIPFKSGIGMLAMHTHCPILPIYIHGSYGIWKRDQTFPKFTGRTAVVFGSPIYCENYRGISKKEAHEAIAKTVFQSIQQLRQWYLDGAQGTPP